MARFSKQYRRKRRFIRVIDVLFILFMTGFLIFVACNTLSVSILSYITTYISLFFSSIRLNVLILLSALCTICACRITYVIVNRNTTKENDSGYLFYQFLPFLQHRYTAEKCLRRKLYKSEEVHHINGRTWDNRPANLCVLFRADHQAFHVWLRAEKHHRGHYPSYVEQENILSERFNGILLRNRKIT